MELELGSLLKKAREEKELSIDDIQEETKIRKKYLEAIEENNFEILPGNVYLKVFIKGYAREVGLDYQELLAKYQVLNIKEKKESNLQKDYLSGTKVSSNSKKKNRKNPFKIIFIILLILFLGAGAVYTYQYVSNSEIRLLNQQSTQEKNAAGESQLSDINKDQSTEIIVEDRETASELAEETDGNNGSSETGTESDINLSETANDNESLADDLLDSFDSSVLNEENTEIIDQNNFDELDGLNSQEQNQITEIIISEENDQSTDNEENIQENEDIALEENNNSNNNNEDSTTADTEEIEEDEEPVVANEITITASDTVWITVDLDGANVFSGILEAGDQQEFELENRLYIKIGNGSAITAEMGSETYGPWAGDGEIAEVEFLREGEEIVINNLRE